MSYANSVWPLRPPVFLAIVSILFGGALIAATPPLRGPDEAAHFLRAFAISTGEFISRTTDGAGRKGVVLPPALYAEFRTVAAQNARERLAEAEPGAGGATGGGVPVGFVQFQGSEGYSPVPYAPHAGAALLARAAGVGFVPTLYLMRFAGLLAWTALLAWTVTLVPARFGWALVAIASLPAVLYGRAMVSADGSTFAFAALAVVIAIGIGPAARLGAAALAATLALGALSKPPNLGLAVLAFARFRFSRAFLVALAATAAAMAWVLLGGGDGGSWRIAELTGKPISEFDPVRKLTLMLKDPRHFATAFLGTLAGFPELWRQLIGVLGLFDTPLRGWAYPLITALLLAALWAPIGDGRTRAPRLAGIAALSAAAYFAAVFIVFYLIWTPSDADQIWGVQGRYFTPALPALTLAVGAMFPPAGPSRMQQFAAMAVAVASGLASLDAVLWVGASG